MENEKLKLPDKKVLRFAFISIISVYAFIIPLSFQKELEINSVEYEIQALTYQVESQRINPVENPKTKLESTEKRLTILQNQDSQLEMILAIAIPISFISFAIGTMLLFTRLTIELWAYMRFKKD